MNPGRDIPKPNSADSPTAHTPNPANNGFYILVVDDNDWNRDIISAYLSPLGIRVHECTSGEAALEQIRKEPPAVVISDWMMPGMSGVDLCRAVRQDSALPSIHFLIVTARDDPKDLVEAFDAGADDFLTKPVRQAELRARVKVGLRVCGLNREIEEKRKQAVADAALLRQAQDRLRLTLGKLDEQIKEISGLQESFLPHKFPSAAGLAFAALCRPCADVGGDYYDVFQMPDGRICVTMADVSGHGAKAAVAMAMTRSLTRAAAAMIAANQGPGWLLAQINDWLCNQLPEGTFVTMWVGFWLPERAEVTYARAAHPPGILWRYDGKPELLSREGSPPVGLFPYPEPLVEESIVLNPGDRIVLYTDGWIESSNSKGDQLEIDGFKQMLLEHDGIDVDSLPLALYMNLERYVARSQITDDVSLLVCERHVEF